MTDVERSGHVRRRDYDGIGLSAIGRAGVEQTGIEPALRPAILDLVGAVSFFELRFGHG
jgi:hypothetical protein